MRGEVRFTQRRNHPELTQLRNALFTGTKGAADSRGYWRRVAKDGCGWSARERASERAPLPLIFAGETQESAGGNEGANEERNVHYFSAASHDRFLARRRQTKIPPRKPRTELIFPQSVCIFRGRSFHIQSFISGLHILVMLCLAFWNLPRIWSQFYPSPCAEEASQKVSLVCVTSNSWTSTNWLLDLPKSCDWAPDPNWTFFQPFLGASSL